MFFLFFLIGCVFGFLELWGVWFLIGILIVKEDFLCVVMRFYARFVWGFEAIARVLLDVWLVFPLLS